MANCGYPLYVSDALEGDLGQRLLEHLALDACDLELELGGVAAAVGAGEGTGTPRRATVDLSEVRLLGVRVAVAERDEDHTVVGEGRQRVHDGGLYISR